MTDIELIKAEIERLKDKDFSGTYDARYALDLVATFINSLPEEPVSEDLEEALAREWQGYNDRGAATVDALEDNTQELAFAKGFYRGAKWQLRKTRYEKDETENL